MACEITMPQLSDTMTEGTLIKWNKKEGDKVKAGEEIAEIETDKATMPMEAFESGIVALLKISAGQKVKVGELLAVLATGSEKIEDVKKKYASGVTSSKAAESAKPQSASRTLAPGKPASATIGSAKPQAVAPAPSKPVAAANPATPKASYQYDIVVIGGGPAGYAAAIRAGQLKKRVFCIEKENLGGTCLNWGCIPTKALLEDGAFVRKLRTEAAAHGITFDNLKVDFSKVIGRSRAVAEKLKNGVGHLFKKYQVKHEIATGQLLAPHRVRYVGKDGAKEVTAEHVILARVPFDAITGYRIRWKDGHFLP